MIHDEERISRIEQLGNKDLHRGFERRERHSVITQRGRPTAPCYNDDRKPIRLRWPVNVHQQR